MNPAQIILDAIQGFSPPSPKIEGSVRFGKIPCPQATIDQALDIFEIPGCITPPFDFTDEPTAFFTAVGAYPEEAEQKFQDYSNEIVNLLNL